MSRVYDYFLYELKDTTAILTINRPEVLNAFSDGVWQELLDFVVWVETQEEIRTVIITAGGERIFVAGADLNDLLQLKAHEMLDNLSRQVFGLIASSRKVYIAAVNGIAYGAGTELSLVCDIRVVSENARFALPETTLGLIPGAGGTQRLPKMVGMGVAKDMILGGRELTGAEAYQFGMAYKVVAPEELMNEALVIADNVKHRAPLGIRLGKEAINYAFEVTEENGTRFEAQAFGICLGSEDKEEGITAFFEKRKPAFKSK